MGTHCSATLQAGVMIAFISLCVQISLNDTICILKACLLSFELMGAFLKRGGCSLIRFAVALNGRVTSHQVCAI